MPKPGHLAFGVLTGILNEQREAFIFRNLSFQHGNDSGIPQAGKSRAVFGEAPLQQALRFFNHPLFKHCTASRLNPVKKFSSFHVNAVKNQRKTGFFDGSRANEK